MRIDTNLPSCGDAQIDEELRLLPRSVPLEIAVFLETPLPSLAEIPSVQLVRADKLQKTMCRGCKAFADNAIQEAARVGSVAHLCYGVSVERSYATQTEQSINLVAHGVKPVFSREDSPALCKAMPTSLADLMRQKS